MRKLTTEEFIDRARKIHGEKYDYSKVEYKSIKSPLTIICKEHGEFTQTADNHLNMKQGCPMCANNKRKTTSEFISDSIKVHGDKYDYSKVNYVNANTLVDLLCHKHGVFKQTPHNHLSGKGCPMCGNDKIGDAVRLDTIEFIRRAKLVHGDKYDYSKVDYVNNSTKVCIICPKHGEFWQKPTYHLSGNGCQHCNESRLESEVRMLLSNNGIDFVYRAKSSALPWLGKQELDFYLPKFNIAIECQGIQHFDCVDFFGGEKTLQDTLRRDREKSRLCKEHGVKMLYYSNLGITYPYLVFENKDDLIKEIKMLC